MTHEKAEFQKQGFTRFASVFSAAEVEEILTELRKFLEEASRTLPERFKVVEAAAPNKVFQISNLDRISPYFGELAKHPRLIALAEDLVGCPVVPFTLHFRNAPPGGSRGAAAHQDAWGPSIDPCDAVTFWISLGDYGEPEGCLRYLPQSHLKKYQPKLWGAEPNPHYETSREILAPTSRGDVLAHQWFTVHRSLPNRGDKERWALMVSYIPASAVRISEADWLAKYGNAFS